MTSARYRMLSVQFCVSLGFSLSSVGMATGTPVVLQNATATRSQSVIGDWLVSETIDGDYFSFDNGWAILRGSSPPTPPETAVWETQTTLPPGLLTFRLYQNHTNPQHLLGRFRFSVTTDDRSLFADGLDNGGDVTANWTVLTGANVTGPAGMNFTIQGDNSILASGTVPDTGVYHVSYHTGVAGITGIRLEALEDPSLPFAGPGFHTHNGNFVITEIEAAITVFAPGDTDGDGDIDTADLTTSLQNFTGDGGTGRDFSTGDTDFDGDVDTADLTVAFQNFTGAIEADLIYDSNSGNVKLNANESPGDVITQFALTNAVGGQSFNTGVANFPFGGIFKTDLPTEISNSDGTGVGFSGIWDLGNIFPTGLDETSLASFLTSATYGGTPGTGSSRPFDLVVVGAASPVPEPGSLALIALGLAGLSGIGFRHRVARTET